jgi:hypothetical protein
MIINDISSEENQGNKFSLFTILMIKLDLWCLAE